MPAGEGAEFVIDIFHGLQRELATKSEAGLQSGLAYEEPGEESAVENQKIERVRVSKTQLWDRTVDGGFPGRWLS